jgi:Flp pilus assembly protein TadD
MESQTGSLMTQARAAMAEGRWIDATASFERALELEDDPDAHFGLGVALWWSGETERALRAWERAFTRSRRLGQSGAVVVAAFYLCTPASIAC